MNQKRKISLMLVIILILQVLLPIISVLFENSITLISEAVTSGEWEYTINEDNETITITKYNGTQANLIIPGEIDGYIVTALESETTTQIGNYRYTIFRYGYTINSIALPNSIKTIGPSAFYGCENLINIELNEGLETIENQAFYNCKKLEKINIPSTVETIVCGYETNQFYGCDGLKHITVHADNQYYSSVEGVLFNKDNTILIGYPSAKTDTYYFVPESVKQIYGCAINNQSLINIHISKNVNNMKGEYWLDSKTNTFAIINCFNLQSVTVDEANVNYYSENGILYNKNKTALLLYPSGKTSTYYEIPNTVSSCTTECGDTTINNSYLEKIKLNRIINNSDFLTSNINLKYIDVDSNNTNYMQKDGVLFNKIEDKLVYFPSGRTEQTYTVDNKVTEIYSKAFMNSKILEIYLPDSITTIGDDAFNNCMNLKNIIIPNNVTKIGNNAFHNCTGLTNVTIPNNVISIGRNAFYNCTNIKELIFEENSKILELGTDAFSNCISLEEVYIPEGITNIDSRFDKCDNLRIINIPSTVEDIPSYSFSSNNANPQIITVNNVNPTIKGLAFENPDCGYTVIRCYSSAINIINWVNSSGPFHYHYNLMDLNEGNEKFIYTIENEQVTVENYIGDEENLEIPSELEGYPVTKIKKVIGTFKNLSIPSTVKEINTIYSRNLQNINVDENNNYFSSENGILLNKKQNELICYPMGKNEIEYNISNKIASINNLSFFGNIYLEKITIPENVTNIGSISFDMNNLREILVDEDNKNYKSKDNILYDTKNDKVNIIAVPINIQGDVDLLYGLTKISTYDFSKRNNLQSVTIPTTVKSISHNSFERCKNLRKIVITESTTDLAEINTENLILKSLNEDFKLYCEDGSIAKEYARKWGIDYEIINVESIKIKQYPNKLEYMKNKETLNLEGALITLNYDDGTSLDLSMTSELLSVTGFDNSTIGNKQIEIDYKGEKTSFSVNVVEKQLTEISVTRAPSDTSYIEGQNFNPAGMIVTATYNDGTTKEVTNYTVTDGNNLTTGKTSVTISYTENGVTKEATQGITVNEEHTWDSGKVTKEPTCKDKGEKTYTCTVCRETRTEEIAVTNNHTWNIGEVTKAPTCKDKGEKTYTCTVCGETRTEEIAVTNNHTWSIGEVTKEPTCKDKGEKTYTCTVCGEIRTEEIAVTNNHTWNIGEVIKEPTCKDKGEKTYTCTVCGETRTEEIAVTNNHTWNSGEVTKEPTCKDKGKKTYTCTVCNKTKIQEIAETGHKYENGVCVNCGENIFTEESKYYIILSELIGISPNTIIGKFITNIMEKYTVKIMKDNQEVTEAKIATGMQIKIFEKEQEVDSCTAVVTGDTDGNGNADIRDMIKINNYRLYGTTTNFEGAYQTAGDVNRDGKIDIKDMIRINNYRLYNTSI